MKFNLASIICSVLMIVLCQAEDDPMESILIKNSNSPLIVTTSNHQPSNHYDNSSRNEVPLKDEIKNSQSFNSSDLEIENINWTSFDGPTVLMEKDLLGEGLSNGEILINLNRPLEDSLTIKVQKMGNGSSSVKINQVLNISAGSDTIAIPIESIDDELTNGLRKVQIAFKDNSLGLDWPTMQIEIWDDEPNEIWFEFPERISLLAFRNSSEQIIGKVHLKHAVDSRMKLDLTLTNSDFVHLVEENVWIEEGEQAADFIISRGLASQTAGWDSTEELELNSPASSWSVTPLKFEIEDAYRNPVIFVDASVLIVEGESATIDITTNLFPENGVIQFNFHNPRPDLITIPDKLIINQSDLENAKLEITAVDDNIKGFNSEIIIIISADGYENKEARFVFVDNDTVSNDPIIIPEPALPVLNEGPFVIPRDNIFLHKGLVDWVYEEKSDLVYFLIKEEEDVGTTRLYSWDGFFDPELLIDRNFNTFERIILSDDYDSLILLDTEQLSLANYGLVDQSLEIYSLKQNNHEDKQLIDIHQISEDRYIFLKTSGPTFAPSIGIYDTTDNSFIGLALLPETQQEDTFELSSWQIITSSENDKVVLLQENIRGEEVLRKAHFFSLNEFEGTLYYSSSIAFNVEVEGLRAFIDNENIWFQNGDYIDIAAQEYMPRYKKYPDSSNTFQLEGYPDIYFVAYRSGSIRAFSTLTGKELEHFYFATHFPFDKAVFNRKDRVFLSTSEFLGSFRMMHNRSYDGDVDHGIEGAYHGTPEILDIDLSISLDLSHPNDDQIEMSGISVQITVDNNGPDIAYNSQIDLKLPNGWKFVSLIERDEILSNFDLNPGEQKVFMVNLISDSHGVFTINADLTGSGQDLDETNNTDSLEVGVGLSRLNFFDRSIKVADNVKQYFIDNIGNRIFVIFHDDHFTFKIFSTESLQLIGEWTPEFSFDFFHFDESLQRIVMKQYDSSIIRGWNTEGFTADFVLENEEFNKAESIYQIPWNRNWLLVTGPSTISSSKHSVNIVNKDGEIIDSFIDDGPWSITGFDNANHTFVANNDHNAANTLQLFWLSDIGKMVNHKFETNQLRNYIGPTLTPLGWVINRNNSEANRLRSRNNFELLQHPSLKNWDVILPVPGSDSCLAFKGMQAILLNSALQEISQVKTNEIFNTYIPSIDSFLKIYNPIGRSLYVTDWRAIGNEESYEIDFGFSQVTSPSTIRQNEDLEIDYQVAVGDGIWSEDLILNIQISGAELLDIVGISDDFNCISITELLDNQAKIRIQTGFGHELHSIRLKATPTSSYPIKVVAELSAAFQDMDSSDNINHQSVEVLPPSDLRNEIFGLGVIPVDYVLDPNQDRLYILEKSPEVGQRPILSIWDLNTLERVANHPFGSLKNHYLFNQNEFIFLVNQGNHILYISRTKSADESAFELYFRVLELNTGFITDEGKIEGSFYEWLPYQSFEYEPGSELVQLDDKMVGWEQNNGLFEISITSRFTLFEPFVYQVDAHCCDSDAPMLQYIYNKENRKFDWLDTVDFLPSIQVGPYYGYTDYIIDKSAVDFIELYSVKTMTRILRPLATLYSERGGNGTVATSNSFAYDPYQKMIYSGVQDVLVDVDNWAILAELSEELVIPYGNKVSSNGSIVTWKELPHKSEIQIYNFRGRLPKQNHDLDIQFIGLPDSSSLNSEFEFEIRVENKSQHVVPDALIALNRNNSLEFLNLTNTEWIPNSYFDKNYTIKLGDLEPGNVKTHRLLAKVVDVGRAELMIKGYSGFRPLESTFSPILHSIFVGQLNAKDSEIVTANLNIRSWSQPENKDGYIHAILNDNPSLDPDVNLAVIDPLSGGIVNWDYVPNFPNSINFSPVDNNKMYSITYKDQLIQRLIRKDGKWSRDKLYGLEDFWNKISAESYKILDIDISPFNADELVVRGSLTAQDGKKSEVLFFVNIEEKSYIVVTENNSVRGIFYPLHPDRILDFRDYSLHRIDREAGIIDFDGFIDTVDPIEHYPHIVNKSYIMIGNVMVTGFLRFFNLISGESGRLNIDLNTSNYRIPIINGYQEHELIYLNPEKDGDSSWTEINSFSLNSQTTKTLFQIHDYNPLWELGKLVNYAETGLAYHNEDKAFFIQSTNFNPNGFISIPDDWDFDGMSNDWEELYGLDPYRKFDAFIDSNGDGEPNIEEFETGQNPIEVISYETPRIKHFSIDNSNIILGLDAVEGFDYVLWLSLDGLNDWVELELQSQKESDQLFWTYPRSADSDSVYFRIERISVDEKND